MATDMKHLDGGVFSSQFTFDFLPGRDGEYHGLRRDIHSCPQRFSHEQVLHDLDGVGILDVQQVMGRHRIDRRQDVFTGWADLQAEIVLDGLGKAVEIRMLLTAAKHSAE